MFCMLLVTFIEHLSDMMYRAKRLLSLFFVERKCKMIIREAVAGDLRNLLILYTHLKKDMDETIDSKVEDIWETMLENPNHHVIIGEENGEIVSSCILTIVPNLTHRHRPYGLIENVVTHGNCRGKGYGRAVLGYAKAVAMGEGCYKIMLMTGSKEKHVHRFYESAGYNPVDKTGYIMWL